jgi:hypothetical protein
MHTGSNTVLGALADTNFKPCPFPGTVELDPDPTTSISTPLHLEISVLDWTHYRQTIGEHGEAKNISKSAKGIFLGPGDGLVGERDVRPRSDFVRQFGSQTKGDGGGSHGRTGAIPTARIVGD